MSAARTRIPISPSAAGLTAVLEQEANLEAAHAHGYARAVLLPGREAARAQRGDRGLGEAMNVAKREVGEAVRGFLGARGKVA